jgi:hypothetical protein
VPKEAPDREIVLKRWRPGAPSVVVAAVCIVVYVFAFAGAGLLTDFTGDDLMNLAKSRLHPAREHVLDLLFFFRPPQTYRPTGSAFYYALFELFGFQALPYRAACYGLLLANLWLAYAVGRRLTDSRRVAGLAVFLHAYHGEFWPIYYSTGYCYDLLCFFFYAAALLYYLHLRGSTPPGPRQIAVWCGLYLMALNAKEMAVSLPVVLLVHTLLFDPPSSWRPRLLARWAWSSARLATAGAALTVVVLAARYVAPGSLQDLAAYNPDFRFTVFLDRVWNLLWYTVYRPDWLTPAVSAAIVFLLALAAAASRIRVLCLVWMVVGILPIAFIEQRPLAAAYIPAFALALYLASLAASSTRGRIVLMVAFAIGVALLHAWQGPFDFERRAEEGRYIRHVYNLLRQADPAFSQRTKVLILRDPFPENPWASTFLLLLYADEKTLEIWRLDRLLASATPTDRFSFQTVLSYTGDRFLVCNPDAFQEVTPREAAARTCVPQSGSRAPGAR